jgi:uncharacterized protein (TIGR02757 family)
MTMPHRGALRRQTLLKQTLDDIAAARSPRYLANDPLSFCHRFADPADQEVAALIASSLAYGAISVILKSLETVFALVGNSPASFCDQFEPQRGLQEFGSFKHRFNDGRDLCALFWAIRTMRRQAGSIEQFFLRSSLPEEDVTAALNGFCRDVLSLDYSLVFGRSGIPADSYFPFFFPSPRSGSACKRLCMFLRWMVRSNDGIDLGVWHSVPPSRLIIPVDTHICRIARYLGLTARKQADWKMAVEITTALRRLDPDDPVKYDFALAHLGISDGCNGADTAVCNVCPISPVCSRTAANYR